jgi:hypothetical protein
VAREERTADALTSGPVADVGRASIPRHQIETAVTRMWAKMLGVDDVGLHDNFLLLGGESLLATQVVSEIRDQLGCDVPIRSIFVSTVAEIAAEIETILSSAGDTESCAGARSAVTRA